MSNLHIWEQVEKSDVKHIKAPTQGTSGLSSIDAYYMFRQATKIFGPVGSGWGFSETSEEYKAGAPILDAQGEIVGSVINHICRINFWYLLDGNKCEFPSIGTTKYIQKTKYGISADEEAPKKSLTDAIKKALSMLGFSSDVYMGKFDNQDYVEGLKLNQQIEDEDLLAEAQKEAVKTIKDWFELQIEAIKKVKHDEQFFKVAESLRNKLNTRCKAAGLGSKSLNSELDKLIAGRRNASK